MSFAHGMVEAVCDGCNMETEPLDVNGSFDQAAEELKKDGWVTVHRVMNYDLLCPDCVAETNERAGTS